MQLGTGANVLDLGDLDKVVDSLAVVFEVEAGVLKGDGELYDGLADLVDLLMGRDLLRNSFSACALFGPFTSQLVQC